MPSDVDGFVARRGPDWAELETLVATPGELTPAQVLRLSAGYRATAADLALARRVFAGNPLVGRLEELVTRAHAVVHDGPRAVDPRAALAFARGGWWALVRGSAGFSGSAAALLLAALAAAASWAAADPAAAARTLPVRLRRVPLAGSEGLAGAVGLPRGVPGLDASWTPAAAVALAVVAVAGGLLGGLGTVAALGVLGLQLGVPAGLALRAGEAGRLVGLLCSGGLLLLALCVLAAGQGLRIGAALVDPGGLPRPDALRPAVRRAVALTAGALPLAALALAVQAAPAGARPVLGLVVLLLLLLGVLKLGREVGA